MVRAEMLIDIGIAKCGEGRTLVFPGALSAGTKCRSMACGEHNGEFRKKADLIGFHSLRHCCLGDWLFFSVMTCVWQSVCV